MADTSDFVPFFKPQVRSVALTANQSVLVCSNSSQRFCLLFSALTGGVCYLAPKTMSGINQGLLLNTGGQPLMLNFRDHGGLVGMEWYCFTTVAGQSIAVIEAMFTPGSD